MHLLLAAEDSVPELWAEVRQSFPVFPPIRGNSALLELSFEVPAGQRLPYLAYARQFLPNAQLIHAESIRAWAGALLDAVIEAQLEGQPWRLHIEPQYHSHPVRRMGARAWHTASRHGAERPAGPELERRGEAGRNRCTLIRDAFQELLQKKRRHLLRELREAPEPFRLEDSLVQVLLTNPDAGFISVARAPLPFEQRHLISPFPKGQVTVEEDKAAPSRAFAKLNEAQIRMGRFIDARELCVDLGAAPGSWTYVAVKRGARVIAVDRSPLVEKLMGCRLVDFRPGDAFRFTPREPVDWLFCDVIAPPERTAELLRTWLKKKWCRNYVVTIKMKDETGVGVLEDVKRELPPLCTELFLTHLCANKKEVCAFGRL